MPNVSIESQLAKKQVDIKTQYDDVMQAVTLVSLFVLIFVLSVGTAFLGLWVLDQTGLNESRPAIIFMVILITICIVAGIAIALLYIPVLAQKYWDRWRDRTNKLLESTELAVMVMERERLDPILAEFTRRPWLRLTGVRTPQTLDEQIEFVSDYFWAVNLLLSGRHGKLRFAVWWGSTTRLIDDITIWLFNSCSSLMLLVVGGLFLYSAMSPVLFAWVALYIKRQAIQSTLVNYFLGDAE